MEVKIYDKAKYHYEGTFPKGLPKFQAYVHTGFFLAWLVENAMLSLEMVEDFKDDLKKFDSGRLSGPQLYEKVGGALADDMLSAEGNAFTQSYFDLQEGLYLADYFETLTAGLPSLYHVRDTSANYARIRERITERYRQWVEQNEHD